MKNGEAFITVIERGEALAEIVADMAGRTNSYNTVSADFVVIPKGVTTLQGAAWLDLLADSAEYLNVYQSIYDSDITLRYVSFLMKKQTTWAWRSVTVTSTSRNG